jgi:ADP-ribose pyrophosphatase YjhB (NUDIX family)
MADSAIVIMFNPDQTLFLVGKETKWISEIDSLKESDRRNIRSLFSRYTVAPLEYNDPEEIAYYSQQISIFLTNPVLSNINMYVETKPARITFGDIEYGKNSKGSYSFVRPRYLPKDRQYKFPGGGKKPIDTTLTHTALREFFEETGIDLTSAPYDQTRLLDTGNTSGGYRIFYYVTNEAEFLQAVAHIAAKNVSPSAELHDLKFIRTNYKISSKSVLQFSKTPMKQSIKYTAPHLRGGKRPNKTRSTNQRWRTRRSRR